MNKTTSSVAIAILFALPQVHANQLEVGRKAILSQTGCYLVDYNYTETYSLKDDYTPDPRIYDVNKNKSVKEWIYADQLTPQRIRLQHVLFITDLSGNLVADSFLKHQVDDWEFDAPFLYEFVAPLHWDVKDLKATPNLWTRKITNLDDGLRYQCAAPWSENTAYPEWSCSNYSPIPGRETRDMGRKDYNTLQRTTRILTYGQSWLERQNNVKTVYESTGSKTQLAQEVGKNWYVRLPDADCDPAKKFAKPRMAFWNLLRETWDEVLTGKESFLEALPPGQPPRFSKMLEVEAEFSSQDLTQGATRASAKQKILNVIQQYRAAK